jgi:hypothetical protein
MPICHDYCVDTILNLFTEEQLNLLGTVPKLLLHFVFNIYCVK